ncbi:MAG: DUF305 domain-containing protein [Gemmatimonadales bacterium]
MRVLLAFSFIVVACGHATSSGRAPERAPASRAVAADIHFMSGMIVHHAQAVVMGGWAVDSVHGAGPAIRALGERIVVGQQDEIAVMERWLRERDEAPPHHATLMPGMLTAAQLARLDAAREAEFDRLFLTLMIQHHQGAITMVQHQLATPGAAQDGLVFRLAADIHADQATEIRRMQGMLAAQLTGGRTP